MKLKDFFDNWYELRTGALLQIPLCLIVGWWVTPIMLVCAVLWRLGGVTGGNKLFRKVGVPLVVCWATYVDMHAPLIFIAIPFMIWLFPSYGKSGFIYKFFINSGDGDEEYADFMTKMTGHIWYWVSFYIVLLLQEVIK